MKRFLKGLGIFLALVAVGITSAFAVIALLLRQEEVRVPDLTGQDIVSVIGTLSQQGLQLKVDRREPHPSVPLDAVSSQTPAPGSLIKKGRLVRVVVSQGVNETQTPKLVGEPFSKAEFMIRQTGFFPGTVSRVSSDDVERDVVIAQTPQPGAPIQKGGGIGLLVSTGKKTTAFIMPRLIGKSAEEAVKIIDRMGLQHRVTYKSAGNKPVTSGRIVVSQKPGTGHPVLSDATVDLVISK